MKDEAENLHSLAPASLREQPGKAGHAKIELELKPAQLRKPEIVHTIVDLARDIGLVAPNDGLFGTVLTELFANALEHGLLGLSSEFKYSDENGLENFARLREEKLAALADGQIKVEIEATEYSGKPATRLRIVDSGPGFDQAVLLSDGDRAHEATAGRGCRLVMKACLKVFYAGRGNDVTAYISSDLQAYRESSG